MSQIRAGIGQGPELGWIDPDPSMSSIAMRTAYEPNNFLIRTGWPVPPAVASSKDKSGMPVRFSAWLVECKIFPCPAR